MASRWKEQCKHDAMILPVEEQYELASKLAANCGYKLVAEDTERSLEIKELIAKTKVLRSADWELLVEGLEALLK